MAEFVSTALGAIVVSLAANSIYDAGTLIASRQIFTAMREARENGKLPSNGDIDRGVQRAAIRACDIILTQLKEPIHQLKHVSPDPTVIYAAWAERDQDHFLRCQNKLRRQVNSLHPNKRLSLNPFTNRAYAKAFKQTRISFEGDTLANPDSGLDLLFDDNEFDASRQTDAVSSFTQELINWAERHVIICGKWPSPRAEKVRAQIRAAFQDPKGGWLTAFRLALAEEIKSDPRLYKIATFRKLDQLKSNQDNISKQVQESRNEALSWYEEYRADAGKLAAYLDRTHYLSLDIKNGVESLLQNIEVRPQWIREELKYQTTSVFNNPPPPPKELASFHYWTDTQSFLGRENSKIDVEKKLLNAKDINGKPKPFAWAAISGRAGVGKSRFAKHIYEANENTFPVSGFVRREFLKFNDITPAFIEALDGDIFLIVDYVSSVDSKDFISFMNNWARLGNNRGAMRRIRILLLLRSAKNPVLGQLLGNNADIQRDVTENYVPLRENSQNPNQVMTLTHLGIDKTAELMKNRMRASAEASGTTFRKFDNKTLISKLEEFDSEMRPLFAAIVADGLQRNDLPESSEDKETARYRLFLAHLKRQRTHRWEIISQRNKSDLSMHEMITAFSTVVRGLTPSQVCDLERSEAYRDIWHYYLPVFEGAPNKTGAQRFDRELYSSMIDLEHRPQGNEQRWSFLEPDLIGECLVIAFISGENEFSCGNDSSNFLKEASWMVAPEQTAFFITLASQDYPDLMQATNWMLPRSPSEQSDQSRAWLLYNLVVDHISKTARSEDPIEVDDVKHLRLILKQFDGQLQDAAEKNIIIADYYGLILQIISEHCANRINPAVSVIDPSEHFRINASDESKSYNDAFKNQAAAPIRSIATPDFEDKASQSTDISLEMSEICLETLKDCYDRSLNFTFASNLPLNTRRIFSGTLNVVLASFYWKHRHGQNVSNKKKSDGRAHSAVTDQEVKEVLGLAETLEQRLINGSINDVSIAAGLNAAMIYSELYNTHSLPEKIIEKSIEYFKSEENIHAVNCRMLTNFLGNYHHILTLKNPSDLDDKLTDLTTLIDLVIERITLDETLIDKESGILYNLISVISRLDEFRVNNKDGKSYTFESQSLFAKTQKVLTLVKNVTGFKYSKRTLSSIISIALNGENADGSFMDNALSHIIENQEINKYDFLYDRESDGSIFIIFHLMTNNLFSLSTAKLFDKNIMAVFDSVQNRALMTAGQYLPVYGVGIDRTDLFARRFKIEDWQDGLEVTDEFRAAFCALCSQYLFEGECKKILMLLLELWREDYSLEAFYRRNCILTVASQLFDIGESSIELSKFGGQIFEFGKKHVKIGDIISMPKASQLTSDVIADHNILLGHAMGAVAAHEIHKGESAKNYIL